MISRLIAASGGVLLLAGCNTTVSGHGRPQASNRPAAAASPAAQPYGTASGTGPVDALAGEYGLRLLNADRSDLQVPISVPGTCGTALDDLEAGEWRVDVVATATKDAPVTTALLQYDGHLAVAFLQQATGRCVGWLATEASVPITAHGALTATATAQSVAVLCISQVGPQGQTDADSIAVEAAVYRAAGRVFVLVASGPAAPGKHVVSGSDGEDGPTIELIVLKPGVPAAVPLRALLKQTTTSGDIGDVLAGLQSEAVGLFAGSGTLTVTSSKPFVATLAAPALRSERGGPALGITAGLHCDP
jgi:hypothetical protein